MLLRIMFWFFVMTSGLQSSAQDAKSHYIDSLMAKETCNCLSALQQVRFESFEPCLMEAIFKDSNAFKLEVERAMGDVSAESMRAYGYKMSKRLLIKLIDECDVFFHLMDSARMKGVFEMSLDSLGLAVNATKPKTGERPSGQHYFVTGMYNLKQGKWADALVSFEEAIKIDPSSEAYRFFKAYTLEGLGRFDEAILIYEQLAVELDKQEYYVFLALVKRLKAEKLK